MNRFWIGLMTVATLMCAATPDTAMAVRGVKYIHFDPAGSICDPNGGLPCSPTAGIGESNKLYIHQNEIDGQLVFSSMSVPGMPDDHMWMAVSYGAECKTGYKLHVGSVRLDYYEGEGKSGTIEVTSWGTPLVLPNAKKMWDTIIDVQVPIEHAFGRDFGPSHVFGFEDEAAVFDYAEGVIADRVAGGMSEEDARAEPFSFNTFLAMNGTVICKGNTFGREFYMARASWVPVELVFVGVGEIAGLELGEPEPPEPGSDELTAGVAVTQAFLSVQPDPFNECRLRLSGVFTTNQPTEISYRFVNELGAPSQSFTTIVDQTQTAMLDHYYDLPLRERPNNGIGGLTTGGRGGLGGLTTGKTDREQGTFQIQVLEPHGYWSNIDGYNVEPCYEPLTGDVGGFKAPTRTPGGGRPPSAWGKRANPGR